MGTTFFSLNVYTDAEITDSKLEFRSFSAGWQTCVTDFDMFTEDFDSVYKYAKRISKTYDAPALCFFIYDSEKISLDVFKGGRIAARYCDDELTPNKNIYTIPSLVGYGDGYKRRLSQIFDCSDADRKTAMLEEYFGVCLLPFPDLLDDAEYMTRERRDDLYKEYADELRGITGKGTPLSLELVSEQPGKIFYKKFEEDHNGKEHFYLRNYERESAHLYDMRKFIGSALVPASQDEYDRAPERKIPADFYTIEYVDERTYFKFNEKAPDAFKNKAIPDLGCFTVLGFDSAGRAVLGGQDRICFIDSDLKLAARKSVKGEPDDLVDDHILTASGNSFWAYEYDPSAKIRIYKIVDKAKKS